MYCHVLSCTGMYQYVLGCTNLPDPVQVYRPGIPDAGFNIQVILSSTTRMSLVCRIELRINKQKNNFDIHCIYVVYDIHIPPPYMVLLVYSTDDIPRRGSRWTPPSRISGTISEVRHSRVTVTPDSDRVRVYALGRRSAFMMPVS